MDANRNEVKITTREGDNSPEAAPTEAELTSKQLEGVTGGSGEPVDDFHFVMKYNKS